MRNIGIFGGKLFPIMKYEYALQLCKPISISVSFLGTLFIKNSEARTKYEPKRNLIE